MNFYYDSGIDDLDAAIHYCKIAFKNLFKSHRFEEAEQVFDAYEHLLAVAYNLEDGQVPQYVYKETIECLKTALEKTQHVLEALE